MTDVVDLLIEGGTVLDGTGSAGFQAAVAAIGGRLRVLRGDTTTSRPRAGSTPAATSSRPGSSTSTPTRG